MNGILRAFSALRHLRIRPAVPHRERRANLVLEALENRLVPSADTWTGNAAANITNPDPSWMNPQNWMNDVAPKAGDSLTFPSVAAAARTSINNYTPGTAFGLITLSGNGYQISGNPVQLQGGVTNSAGFNTLALDVTLDSAQNFTESAGTLELAGSINNGGYLLTVQTSENVLFTGKSICGSGGLTVEGNGFSGKFFLQDSTPDTYSGVTTVLDAAVVYLDGAKGNAIVGNLVAGDGPGPVQSDDVHLALNNQIANASSVTVYADGMLDLDGFNDTLGSLTMSGGFVTTGTGTLTLNGNITTLAAGTTAEIDGALCFGTNSPKTFTIASGSAGTDLNVNANVSGSAELLKVGAGTLRLSGDNSYTGGTVISAGTLTAASADALGTGRVCVASGATLEYATSGSSTLSINGNLSNSGAVEIDGADTVGTLSVNGNYTQAAGATLKMGLAGTNSYDRLAVSDSAVLGGTLTIGLQNGFRPVGGNTFQIMTFDSSSNTFSTVNLPMSRVLVLNYDPHDLTIVDTAAPPGNGGPSVPPGADVWIGAGANADWSNGMNWAAGVAPKAGDTLYFPPNPTSLVSINDETSGTTFSSLVIAGCGYQITGNPIQLENGLTAENTCGANTVALPMALLTPESITDLYPNTSLFVTNQVNNCGNPLTVNSNGSVVFENSAIIGAGGLTVEGNGSVTLADSDAFTGPTVVQSGTLIAANAIALSSSTTVVSGATLALENGIAINSGDSLTLNGFGVNDAGALQAIGGNETWNGNINLASNTAIGTSAGAALTIGANPSAAELTNGVITGLFSSNISYVGSGTVVLDSYDSYLGYTTVAGGILALDNVNALTGAPYNGGRGTGVDSGATLELLASGTYALDPLVLSGTGVNGMGALVNEAGNNIWQGPFKLNGNATVTSAAGSSLTLRAEISNEGYTLTVNAVGDFYFANCIAGAGGLIKNGTGTLTFSGPSPNVYAGLTVINAGTLFLNKPSAIFSITGDVLINPGGTLAGSGTIGGSVTNDGTVSPGGSDAIGSLAIQGNYTQAANAFLDMEIASSKAFDQLMLSGWASLDGTLDVSLLNGFQPKKGDTFPLLTYGSYSGLFSTVNLPNPGSGVVLSDVYDPLDLTIMAQASISGA